jgi:hypothetical protein
MWNIEIYNPVTTLTVDIALNTVSIAVDEKLDNEMNTFKLTCKHLNGYFKFNRITIKENNTLRYSGIILNQSDRDGGGIKITDLECIDWAYLLSNRVIREIFSSSDVYQGRPDLILKYLIPKYASEITTNNIRDCYSVIDTLQFPYVYFLDAMKDMLDHLNDWHWYIDYDKDMHFFKGHEKEGIIFAKDSNTSKYNFLNESLTVNYKGDAVANRIWIIGAKQASPQFIEQFFTGDGSQRYFTLAYDPNYTEVYVNNVLKKSKLENNDDGTQDFLINKKERVVYIPSNIITPFTGTIKVKYRPSVQVIDYFENIPSIEQYGLIERTVKNKNITDKLSARKFGKAEIKRVSKDKRIVSFATREKVALGERCRMYVKETDWDIDGYFLVTSVSTAITAKDELRSIEMEEII